MHASRPRLLECHPIDAGQDVDASRREPDLEERSGACQVGRSEVQQRGAEASQRAQHSRRVVGCRPHPDVKVAGRIDSSCVTSLRFAKLIWRSCGLGVQARVGDLTSLHRGRQDAATIERDPPAAWAVDLRDQLVDVEPAQQTGHLAGLRGGVRGQRKSGAHEVRKLVGDVHAALTSGAAATPEQAQDYRRAVCCA
jgi:hypothetical protein